MADVKKVESTMRDVGVTIILSLVAMVGVTSLIALQTWLIVFIKKGLGLL
jgi:hypothetical protein